MNSLNVEDLGKRYQLKRVKRERAALDLGIAKMPLPWSHRSPGRELWALRHVSFTLKPGTVLGIIGPNGAGKSTLLKILARVVRPTEGRVVGRGRVVSLLELGAGFNQDLSARENIFMNAAMHGIPRHEVQQQLGEIFSFADIGDFIDQPLRHYSSGMYLRLAFSVAINMRPYILLADEILAVGDLAFQERCLRRVEEEGRNGLTVLFVSHDMSAVARICQQALWLNGGEVVQKGDAATVVADYQQAAMSAVRSLDEDERAVRGGRLLEVLGVRLISASDARVIGAAPVDEDVCIRIRLRIRREPTTVRFRFELNAKQVCVLRSAPVEPFVFDTRGIHDVVVRIPARLLAETGYIVNLGVDVEAGKTASINLPHALSFMTYGDSYISQYKGGVINPVLGWSTTDPAVGEMETSVR